MNMNRREFLRSGGFAAAATFVGVNYAQAAPRIELLETSVISHHPEFYHGWPTVARRRNGQLLLLYSGGREAHVCPFGRVEMMVSSDEARTWTFPQVLLDSAMDDRDAGVLETRRGSVLVTTFTSLAYEPILEAAERKKPGQPGAWPAERLSAWRGARDRLTPAQRRAQLGEWMIRSTDGGVTWSARYPTIVNSPHGPAALDDGRLLYAGKELWTEQQRVGVCESLDDGQTWRWLAAIPTRPGDDVKHYHELHAVDAGENRIIVQIRNHNQNQKGETLQSESTDGGRTWSVPRGLGVWGLPSFLLRLRNDNLLMTYSHRRPPFGNQARLSQDRGRTWSEPLMISADGASGDLGYPSTAELEDGSLLTVWYEGLKSTPRTALRQARWRLKS